MLLQSRRKKNQYFRITRLLPEKKSEYRIDFASCKGKLDAALGIVSSTVPKSLTVMSMIWSSN